MALSPAATPRTSSWCATGALWTSSGRYCFNGITRATILRLAREAGFAVHEGDYTLAEVYAADEAFVTGTLGRHHAGVGDRRRASCPRAGMGPLTQRLADLYQQYITAPQKAAA